MGATHRSFLPLGLGFPASTRSSSSDGCTYRNRLRRKKSEKLGLGAKNLNLVLKTELLKGAALRKVGPGCPVIATARGILGS